MSADGDVTRPFVSISRLTVRDDRIVCEVVLAPDAPRRTSGALATQVRAAFPGIDEHACLNAEGRTFGAVIDHTSLPHMLEHLVIHLQALASAPGTPAFVGTTELEDAAGLKARIEVGFTDDLVALRAFRDATAFLNAALASLSS